MRYEYNIKKLHCASCALKIEQAFSALDGISLATIDLDLGKLKLDASAKPDLTNLNQIANKIEYGTEITDYQENTEQTDEKDYTLAKIIISAILFAIGLVFEQDNLFFMLIFFAVPYAITGLSVLKQAFFSIKSLNFFNEYTLMSTATIAAIAIGELPEAVGVMLFYSIGEYLQEKATKNSRQAIRKLLANKAQIAHVLLNMQTIDKKPEEIKLGEQILVKAGEQIPLDSQVLNGTSELDTSSLTGETLPVKVQKGDKVYAGTINLSNSLVLQVTALYQDSSQAKIMEIVENATAKKAQTEKFITNFAKYYTPVVFALAMLVAFVPPLLGYGTYSDFIYRGLVLLVISCPCALVISIPLAYFSGIGYASKLGILVKGGQVFDALKNIQNIAFDKTGTLTQGVFEIIDILPAKNIDKATLLSYATIAEYNSNHPIAKSIINANPGFTPEHQISSKEIAGQGIICTYNNETIYAGNAQLLNSNNIQFEQSEHNNTSIFVAKNNEYLGQIILGDKIKADSPEAIKLLRKYQLIMLSGDKKNKVADVANELQLDAYYAELSPEDKVQKLLSLKPENSTLYVGDGLNDAPVLASAQVSVAMGKLGSDISVELADAVILNDSPKKIANLLDIAKNTRAIVWQNISFALGIKILIMFFGVAGLSGLWEAIFADVGVALLAILNSSRISLMK